MANITNDYIDAHSRLVTKLDAIRLAATRRHFDFPESELDGLNYGHVGSLNEANRLLAEIMQFLRVGEPIK